MPDAPSLENWQLVPSDTPLEAAPVVSSLDHQQQRRWSPLQQQLRQLQLLDSARRPENRGVLRDWQRLVLHLARIRRLRRLWASIGLHLRQFSGLRSVR